MNKIFKTLSIIALSAIITFASSSAAFAATPKNDLNTIATASSDSRVITTYHIIKTYYNSNGTQVNKEDYWESALAIDRHQSKPDPDRIISFKVIMDEKILLDDDGRYYTMKVYEVKFI
ncbi:hypothetical protein EXM98_07875 [Clostridium botulinum]|uniref:Uncharacterized protein n=2 Tax=Clostridium TaxID=1485 RepID=B1IF84_CLOBK|nr:MULTISPECIES: hypothetical protein [Clostridium]EKX78181.1 hypothetical protein CFSAN001628_021125 [Clostridium botulinum CFSAN001628]ACA46153.1 hypothetical protein CLD_3803 [Clostridium botulinum B1 str. Okra]APH19313.1 hypothetical protein NPD3_3179 [Clostridium botulinum]AUM90474.1 hypothetical protein RSJ5_04045 [Clostridium botulinum]KEI77778.1 hypothetical protein N452_03830 [Clostridium botulinum A2 117]